MTKIGDEPVIIQHVESDPKNRLDILGFPVDALSLDGAVSYCRSVWEAKRRARLLTLNPVMVEAALRDEMLAGLIRRADLVVADGVGIAWAAKKLHHREIEVVPGIELASALLDECSRRHHPVFLIGGEEGVAAEAAEELAGGNSDLRILGTHHGYFDAGEDERIIELVNASGAHLVLCGMGFPRQDAILEKIIGAGKPPPCYDGTVVCEPSETGTGTDIPPVPTMVGIGVGGSLDVFAGRVGRAPEAWRRMRVEWLGRMLSQPGKRLRHFPALLRFWWRVQSAKR